MKRFLALLVALIMILPMAVTVNAETAPSLSLENVSASQGETVEMQLSISNNPGLIILNLQVSYNTEALELTSVTNGSILTGVCTVGLSAGKILLEAVNVNSDVTADGVLATLTFTVKSTAAVGNYSVNVSTLSGSNAALNRVTPSAAEGTITVTEPHTHNYSSEWSKSETEHWHGCSGCSDKKDKNLHDYDNACDTECNVCGYTRVTTHQHSTDWSKSETEHWHECAECGDKKDKSMHTPGPAATETTPQICTICQYVIQPALGHRHVTSKVGSVAPDCTHAGNIEYYTCSCGKWFRDAAATSEIINHSDVTLAALGHLYSKAPCTEDAVCTRPGCGAKGAAASGHSFDGKWHQNAAGHWHECTTCGAKQSDPIGHTPGAAATETAPQVCTVCGYEIAPALGHTHSYDQKIIDDKYLKSAATCRSAAVYYYSCTCGKQGSEFFEHGNPTEHTPSSDWMSDDSSHWHACTVCGEMLNSSKHELEWRIDREPTAADPGLNHEECIICGFKNATAEMPMLDPTIIDGKDGQWTLGSEDGLIFRSDAAFVDFVAVLVDGQTVDKANYTVMEGSIVVTLDASFMETLTVGKHTLTIRSVGGDATTEFEIAVGAEAGSNNAVIIVVAAVVVTVGVCVGVILLIVRKKRAA